MLRPGNCRAFFMRLNALFLCLCQKDQIQKSSRGRLQISPDIMKAPIIRAHGVNFARWLYKIILFASIAAGKLQTFATILSRSD